MIRSAVTISLIKEARGGPFVFWDDLADACRKAQLLGFDAVEVFAPDAEAVRSDVLRPLLEEHKLRLAALGTGGGWLLHRLSLTADDPAIRSRARDFIRSLIDAAGQFGASAIVGSMQGRWSENVDCDSAMQHLRDSLIDLGEHARQYNVPLLYEPLNRYETNLITTQAEGVALLRLLKTENVKLLADLYHMNIEEQDLTEAIRETGSLLGHVHFADSNRRPMGLGHTDMTPIARALREIGYNGYVSAECLPYPDPDSAAEATIRAFRRYFGEGPIG